MPQIVQTIFGKLPAYWRLATVRCCLYAAIVGWGVFKSGLGGFNSLAEMSSLQFGELVGDTLMSMGAVWLAFIDNTIAKVQDGHDTQYFAKPPTAEKGDIMKKTGLLAVLLSFAGLLVFSGCRTQLDTAGVYTTKFGPLASWMYAQDNLVDSAVKTVDAAETWELQNHSYLVTNSPQTVVALSGVRIQTKQAVLTYYQERESLAAIIASTNPPALLSAVSNSIVITVSAINTYSGKAAAVQTLK